MFEYKTTIRMHDVDAAGLIFFANQFRLVHEAFETFMDSKGLGLGKILKEADYIIPVVHAETSYKTPLKLGDKITISLNIKKLGETSFTLGHEITKADGTLAGVGEIVHVAIDRKTNTKIPLPKELTKIF